MSYKLSIIIPCYNCAQTLEEAVASVYRQGLEEAKILYEVVMVNDGSTDNTQQEIERLSKKYPHIRYFSHDKNRGGGAARNTAVEKSEGDIIFCLDSDDMLGDGTLAKMVVFLDEKRCDGVGVSTSIKFKGRNIDDIAYISQFGYVGEKIPFESLLQREGKPLCPLYSTFLITKKAFEIAGGYPTDHGFDTQGLAWRFLANGLVVYTCPNTTYYHRVNFHKSYYIREYESGKVNYNWFKIFVEFLYLFDNPVQRIILSYNLNNLNTSVSSDVFSRVNIFTANYKQYLICGGKELKRLEIENNISDASVYDLFWVGNEFFVQKDYKNALSYFLKSKEKESFSIIDKKIQLCKAALGGARDNEIRKMEEYMDSRWKRSRVIVFLQRVARKIKRIIKKNERIYLFLVQVYIFIARLNSLLTERGKKNSYYAHIERIKQQKKIVVDLRFGGIGDCLAYSTLPRLLKEQYGVDFYLSRASMSVFRHKDVYVLCFEKNPYFRGISDDKDVFCAQSFESERSLYNFITDKKGENVIERLERQFGLKKGRGKPELYYKPRNLAQYKNVILIDTNTISGKKFGWKFKPNAFEMEAEKYLEKGDRIVYANPSRQDLFTYADMIYSCKWYIGTSSGGAAIAACFDRSFSVLLPYNALNGSVYQFCFRNSKGSYVVG